MGDSIIKTESTVYKKDQHGTITALTAQGDTHNGDLNGTKVKITPEGGIAINLVNKTGSASIKGTVVMIDTTINNACKKIVVDDASPIGVIYESGIADGSEIWVVVIGIAEVYFVGNATRGHIARGFLAADSGYISGQALSEAYPGPPFTSDKHFYEIGHVIESRTGAGLAKCVLHFN